MDQAFLQHAAIFVSGILTPIAKYAKDNADAIKTNSVENIVNAFRQLVPPPPVSSIAANAPSLPSALSGGAFPATGLSNLNAVATASKKRTGGTGGKAAQQQQKWYTLDDYKQYHSQRARICAYMPNRGTDPLKKGHVCGGPAINADEESDQLKWRCVVCNEKVGEIVKKFGSVQGARPPTGTPGYTVPSGSIPNMPNLSLPAAPVLPNAVPQLPGSLAPPGSIGIPPLPSMPQLSGANNNIPPLPVQLPGNAPAPALPGQALPPLPGASSSAPVEQKQFSVIESPNLGGLYFVQDEKYRQLAIIEVNSDLVCIGKVQGFTPVDKADTPKTYAEGLIEPSKEDFAYLKTNEVLYNFKGQSAAASQIS